jgi:hypothetical protein
MSTGKETPPRLGVLCLHTWYGSAMATVQILRETPKRYEILNTGSRRTLLPGGRWLAPGDTALVPKATVRLADGTGRLGGAHDD